MGTTIRISPEHLQALKEHLFVGEDEQAAFAFAAFEPSGNFQIESLERILPEGFAFQSDYHIELSSVTQAQIIKHAFDLKACLIEFHSHRCRGPAQFSWSDFHGFEEFVPHVRWRLGARPYAAVVFHESSFDGLAWTNGVPVQLDRIEPVGLAPQRATGLSLRALEGTLDR